MNTAAVSMTEQALVEQDAESFGHMPRSGIAGLCDYFYFWEFPTLVSRVVLPDCNPTSSRCGSCLSYTHLQHFPLVLFICCFYWVNGTFNVVLICISLLTMDDEPFLKYFLAFCMSDCFFFFWELFDQILGWVFNWAIFFKLVFEFSINDGY